MFRYLLFNNIKENYMKDFSILQILFNKRVRQREKEKQILRKYLNIFWGIKYCIMWHRDQISKFYFAKFKHYFMKKNHLEFFILFPVINCSKKLWNRNPKISCQGNNYNRSTDIIRSFWVNFSLQLSIILYDVQDKGKPNTANLLILVTLIISVNC